MSSERFEREEVEKEDGRYIVFYTFEECGSRREKDDGSPGKSTNENRNGRDPAS